MIVNINNEVKQIQVEKLSGQHMSFRLDRFTIDILGLLQDNYKAEGYNYSQGNMVRRAIRHYWDFVQDLGNDTYIEHINISRAKAGVL